MFEEPTAPKPAERRSLFFGALTGRTDAEVTGKSGNVAGMLRTLYSRPDGKISSKNAAKDLGVSQRTIQRWVKGEQAPKAGNLDKLNTAARRAATTKAGRRKAVQSQKHSRLAQRGARLTIRGNQGVPGSNRHGDSYTRFRSASLQLTPVEFQDLLDAYAEHGDTGLQQYLQDEYTNKYGAGTWNVNFISELELHDL